ncbi:FkbM family methyltransferase [Belnapia moabensis]|uniref:FkbM family methyltransferase n=1 Tax=Belnapia moabensis TaxID=365533 RepID=UPI001470223B|nr:FkbM family methyltransferase [Belnapia moabensis]
MSFISYAQNFEDVILRRVFRDVEAGFYVDVGAWDPVSHSVTKAFYDAGWRGINIEPGPMFTALAAARPRDINLHLAVSDRSGRMRLHVHRAGDRVLGTSTLYDGPLPDLSGTLVTKEDTEVEVLPLVQVLDHHAGDRHIHFLKIDAEGAEAAIIRGADWRRHRPEVVVIEATRPNTQDRTQAEWEPLLTDNGYRLVLFDGLNAWYLREESSARAEAFWLPPNIFDDFRVALELDLERRLAASEEWGHAVQQTLQQTQQYQASLEQGLAQVRDHAEALEQALQQAQRDLKRTRIAHAAEAACAAAYAHQVAEQQAELAQHAERVSDLTTALAATDAQLADTEAERRRLAAERWRLVQDLRMPAGPRILQLILPAARLVRRLAWAGRVPAASPPPDIAVLVKPHSSPAAERRPSQDQFKAPTPSVTDAPPAPAAATDREVNPQLARSVEAALLTLTLRGGQDAAGRTS